MNVMRVTTIRFAVVLVAATSALAGAAGQRTFSSPDEAMSALVTAARGDDVAALLAILGPEGTGIISSGDEVADRAERARFAQVATEKTRLEPKGSDRVVLNVGSDDWPFPIPMVKQGAAWRFDTAAGKNELLNRRIGRNELSTIEVCNAYVDAQREYALRGDGSFAERFRSTPGKHDGLYWEAAAGEPESPMGPLAAEATREGYGPKSSAAERRPYHGYFFKILTAQGPHAPEGARSYVADGHMTGGFALVAYPVDHGASGVMTFVVNEVGIVFQKNLGTRTAAVAEAMTRYDPDDSWDPVD
jgi:hypothetical protein